MSSLHPDAALPAWRKRSPRHELLVFCGWLLALCAVYLSLIHI